MVLVAWPIKCTSATGFQRRPAYFRAAQRCTRETVAAEFPIERALRKRPARLLDDRDMRSDHIDPDHFGDGHHGSAAQSAGFEV